MNSRCDVDIIIMAKKRSTARSIDLDLKFKPTNARLDPMAKRFDIFLIDTGWNQAISKAVHSHLSLFFSFEKEDSFYILSPEQSIEILRGSPHLIGNDPIILAYDIHAPNDRKARGYHGFRLNLGLIKHSEQAVARLQEFLRFIALNRTIIRLDRSIQRELYREGFDGMIKILRDTSLELL
jgi:hypothetical protein